MPQIRLNLPSTWDALSPAQLEEVSRLFIAEARQYTLTGEYDRTRLMVNCFFAISGLRVTSLALSDEAESNDESVMGNVDTAPVPRQFAEAPAPDAEGDPSPTEASEPLPRLATPSTPPEHTYYLCEYRDLALRNKQQTVDGRVVPIRIYLDEIMSLTVGSISERDITRYLKKLDRYYDRVAKGKVADEPEPPEPQGPLSWLLKPSTRTIFPYPELTLPDPHHAEGVKERWLDPQTLQPAVRTVPETVTLSGPAEMMQDFSWRQYRFACDFMTYLAQTENMLLDAQKRHQTRRAERLTREVNDARAQFLATLFSRPVLHMDPRTSQLVYTPHFLPSQCTDNAYLFSNFPEEQFQAISFWWQGMMHYLSGEFPKVFRSQKVGGASAGMDDPFVLYTRSTATMLKYAAINEEEVNDTTYTIILQQMQLMAEENDRIDALKN